MIRLNLPKEATIQDTQDIIPKVGTWVCIEHRVLHYTSRLTAPRVMHLNAPPCSKHVLISRFCMRMLNVHDLITHGPKRPRRLHFREEVSNVVMRSHERHTQFMFLHTLAHIEVMSFDVLHPTMVFRIVADINAGAVVHV